MLSAPSIYNKDIAPGKQLSSVQQLEEQQEQQQQIQQAKVFQDTNTKNNTKQKWLY